MKKPKRASKLGTDLGTPAVTSRRARLLQKYPTSQAVAIEATEILLAEGADVLRAEGDDLILEGRDPIYLAFGLESPLPNCHQLARFDDWGHRSRSALRCTDKPFRQHERRENDPRRAAEQHGVKFR